MEFIDINESAQDKVESSRIMEHTDPSDPVYNKLLDRINNSQRSNWLDVLNSINNQGLKELNLEDRYFVSCFGKASLNMLSHGEQLFLVDLMADYLKEKIYIGVDIREMPMHNLAKFITKFGDSDYVNVVYYDEGICARLEFARDHAKEGCVQ